MTRRRFAARPRAAGLRGGRSSLIFHGDRFPQGVVQAFQKETAVRKELKKLWRVALMLAVGGSFALAQSASSPPDQVEEDWQVVIAEPDSLAVGPQVTTIMSPNSDPTAAFVTFYLNYRDYPMWLPGGLQIKAYGAAPDATTSAPLLGSDTQGTEICQTSGETITWTQRLTLSGGSLSYNVVNGQSTTWGQFGQGQGSL